MSTENRSRMPHSSRSGKRSTRDHCRCSCIRRRHTASLGFTFDTSLAVARMIYDGFFDRYRGLRIIAAHGGGALPYLVSRMDQCYENIPACREKISVRPSEYLPQIYADAV